MKNKSRKRGRAETRNQSGGQRKLEGRGSSAFRVSALPLFRDFLKQKRPLRHDLLFVEPDVEEAADAVNMGRTLPGLAGVLAIGMAEGDVDAGEFLVLQDVADDAGAGEVGADGELADAVGVLVRVAILVELLKQLLVRASEAGNAVVLDLDRQRRGADVAVFLAEVIADDAIHDEAAVRIEGRGEDLAPRQVAPLGGGDEAGGFGPLQIWRGLRHQVGSGSGFAGDAFSATAVIH